MKDIDESRVWTQELAQGRMTRRAWLGACSARALPPAIAAALASTGG